MLAGFGGSHGLPRVVRMAGADVHRLDIGLAQHFVEIGVDGFNAGLFGVLPSEGLDNVAHRGEMHAVGMPQVSGHMCRLEMPPGADKADFQWLGHVTSVPMPGCPSRRDGQQGD